MSTTTDERPSPAGAPNAKPTARSLLRYPFAWSLVVLGGLLAATMTFSYLHGFLEPTRRLENLPVGIVNLDRGATFGTTTVDAGQQVLQQATARLPGAKQPLEWHVFRSRNALVKALRTFDVYGGFVIPSDFSARIVTLGTSFGHAPPANLDVLQASGVGTFGVAVFDRVSTTVTSATSTKVRAQLVDQLQRAGATLDPNAVAALGNPVRARTTDVVPISETSGRGLAPFYFALMMTLAGFAATTVLSIGVDVLAGHEEFDVLGRIIRFPDRGITESARWRAKVTIALAMAPVAALLETVIAVNVLGMDTSSWLKTFLFAWLGISAIAAITLVFLTAFGIIGELVAVIFITILGVPSALGVFPSYAVPAFFKFTSSWHPMRYETDGARAILFFGARGGAGLTDSIVVLAAYLVGAIALGGGTAAVVDYFLRRHPKVLALD